MFEVESLALDSYSLPVDARVFVEAYRQTVCERFSLNTVASCNTPWIGKLDSFGSPGGVLFRIKVTSQPAPKGLLLAIADRIRPVTDKSPTRSFLSVLPKNLGEQAFRVAWDGSDEPLLEVNKRLGKEIVHSTEFRALAMPAVMQEILTRFLVIEKRTDMGEDSSACTHWLNFGTRMAGRKPPEPVGDDEEEPYLDWIDDAIRGFCEHNRLSSKFDVGESDD